MTNDDAQMFLECYNRQMRGRRSMGMIAATAKDLAVESREIALDDAAAAIDTFRKTLEPGPAAQVAEDCRNIVWALKARA